MKSKKNSSNEMKNIRKKIDAVDSKILPLMVKRSFLVNQALKLKSKKSEIVDLEGFNSIKEAWSKF